MRRFLIFISCWLSYTSVCFAQVEPHVTLIEGKTAFEQKDYKLAFVKFEKISLIGHDEGRYYLARMLELGLGHAADYKRAFQLYHEGAKQGHIASLNRVALMYYRGERDVRQDFNKAAVYFKKAAKFGDANAQFNLGKMVFEGKLGKRDMALVLSYYEKAAARDHVLALNTLGALYRVGMQGPKDLTRSKSFYLRSAKLGSAEGLYQTGIYTLKEKLDRAHLIEAHMYMNLSSALKHPKAAEALLEIGKTLRPKDLVVAQERANSFRFKSIAQ